VKSQTPTSWKEESYLFFLTMKDRTDIKTANSTDGFLTNIKHHHKTSLLPKIADHFISVT
jgi:hypothetical protein